MKKLNKLLALVLAMVMVLGLSVTAMGAWYDEAVKYVTEKGLMDNASETDFAPDANADRATVVVALYRLAGSPDVTAENVFTDVAEDAAYRNAVVWAKETEVTKGATDTTFAPTDPVTREQFTAFLWRYAKDVCKYDVTVDEAFTLTSFKDTASIHSWASDSIRWACSLGLMQGSNNLLNPLGNIKRSELATFVMRYAEHNFEAGETEEPDAVATLAEHIAEANKLANKQFLPYESTITGVITDDPQASSRTAGSYKFTVSDGTNSLLCYYVPVAGGTPKKGDTVTVTGKLTAYNGKAQFSDTNSSATWISAGTAEPEKPAETLTDAEAILKAGYALAEGEKMSTSATLTGKITKIDTAWSDEYKNITVTIVVDGFGDMPIMCFRLKGDGAKELAVGDTITVTGTIMNYKGTVEFDAGCTLDAVIKG